MTDQALPDSELTGGILTGPGAATSALVDTFEHTLDSKARLTLPPFARARFTEGGLLVPWTGPCIAAFTDAGFARWIRYARTEIRTAGYDSPGAHLAYAHAQATRFRPDAQGRFILADRVRFAADIDRDVTVVGAGNRIELWNPATYGRELEEYQHNLRDLHDGFDLLDDPS
jgi:MraZ protein